MKGSRKGGKEEEGRKEVIKEGFILKYPQQIN